MKVITKVCKDCGNEYTGTVLPITRCPDRDCIEQREAVAAIDAFVDDVNKKVFDAWWLEPTDIDEGASPNMYLRLRRALAVMP